MIQKYFKNTLFMNIDYVQNNERFELIIHYYHNQSNIIN